MGNTLLQRHRSLSPVALLAAVLLPLIAQYLWLMHNTQLPIADADEQLRSAYMLYHYLADGEISKFLRKLYVIRGGQWRPTAYYIIQLPFLLISHGNLMFAVRAATLACTLVTCLYINRLLCLALAPWLAALGTALLGLVGIVQWPGTLLGFSESAFLPAVLATCYHLLRSDDLRDGRQCAYMVIAAGVAFMMRPVEAAMHLVPLFAFFLFILWQQRKISGQTIALIAVGGLVSLSLLFLGGMFHHGSMAASEIYTDPARGHFFNQCAVAIYIATVLGVILLAWTRRGANPCAGYGLHSFVALYAFIILFYFPYVTKLVEWVYMCSVGPLGAANQRPPLTDIVIDNLLLPTGCIPFLGITILGMFAWITANKESRLALVKHPLAIVLSVIPITLLMILFSPQFLLRKATVILTVWLLVMLMLALTPGRFRPHRIVAVALLAVVQFTCMSWMGTALPMPPSLQYVTGSAAPIMVTLEPNPNEVLTEFLLSNAKRHHYTAIGLAISTDNGDIVDPFLLSAMATIYQSPAAASYHFIARFDDSSVKNFLAGNDSAFLLIHELPGEFKKSSADANYYAQRIKDTSGPNDKLDASLAYLYAQGKLETMGVRKGECIMLAGLNKEACLFEIVKH